MMISPGSRSSRPSLMLSLSLAVLVAVASAVPSGPSSGPSWARGLVRRQMGDYAVTGVPVAPYGNFSLPARLEIRELQRDEYQWNLYLLGLNRLQSTDQDEMLSWYQIAGIHGRPFVDWNGVPAIPGQENRGYCTHGSALFPTWHRPYLALYEQVLYNLIQQIANGFNGTDRDRHVQAAATFRVPYWDWAAEPDGDGPVLPASVSSSEDVQVVAPNGTRSIPNPLFRYTFRPLDTDELPDAPISGWASTLRYPSDESPSAVSRNGLVEQQLRNNRQSYRDRLYNLFTAYDNYTRVSNNAWFLSDGGDFDSMESVHDQIHGLVGNDGHMSYVEYSAMDPIFFLHHAMMDRVTAMWQVLHPDAWVEPVLNQVGTRTIATGTTEDANTPLTPFRAGADGTFWTSATVRSVRTFGYTYPELDGRSLSPERLRRQVRAAVNRLYGGNAPGAATRRRRRRSLDRRAVSAGAPEIVAEARAENATGVADRYAPAPVEPQPEEQDKYFEYIANIRVKKNALDSSYFVHVFLGDFDPDPFSWTFEPSLVGSHCVFARKGKRCNCPDDDGALDVEVAGAIPLTTTLLAGIEQGCLGSLDPTEVDAYLIENLHWRVSTLDDKVIPNDQVPGLSVSVVSSEVKRAESDQTFPEWGAFTIREDATQRRRTGY